MGEAYAASGAATILGGPAPAGSTNRRAWPQNGRKDWRSSPLKLAWRLRSFYRQRRGSQPERREMVQRDERSIWVRLGWMAIIWLASVAALGAVAAVLRWWLIG